MFNFNEERGTETLLIYKALMGPLMECVHDDRDRGCAWAQQHGFLLTKAYLVITSLEYPTCQQQK